MSVMGHQRYRISEPAGPSVTSAGRLRWVSRAILATCLVYGGAIGGAWAAVRWSSAESWPVHLLLYGPRWVLSLPLMILVPLAVWRRSRWSAAALLVATAGFLALWGFVPPRLELVGRQGQGRRHGPADLARVDLQRPGRRPQGRGPG